MRYFWLFIAGLVVVTGVLNVSRRAGEANAATAGIAAAPDAGTSQSFGRPSRTPKPSSGPVAEPSSEVSDASEEPEPIAPLAEQMVESAVEPVIERDAPVTVAIAEPESSEIAETALVTDEPIAPEDQNETALSLDALLGVIEEAKEMLPEDEVVQAATDPMLEAALAGAEEAGDAGDAGGTVGPAFTVRGDGAVEVEGAGIIVGDGSPQRPYVLDWAVMRSVARDYNPKQGQEQLPDWVKQLDGKSVRVEGNTLLPVVAAAVDELLVMQNPWDGCCIGIPPTPYDAIEVKLAELTRMGNTATGYGQVEGTFKVDPYLVQGWLLGLYVIEDASFESAAGMELPGL